MVLGVAHQLRADAIDHMGLKFDIGVTTGDIGGSIQEEPIGGLQDVCLVNYSYLFSAMVSSVIEGILRNPSTGIG
ncbi:hypothetical protein ES703_107574 [subsurface metagenome]